MAVSGLRFCVRAFSSCGKRGHSSSRCAGLSLSQPLLLRSTGSRRTGSVVVAHGPSCSTACGIFPDQGSNPRPLHWQADSQPLRHQGIPLLFFLIYFIIYFIKKFFLGALGLRCCVWTFSSCGKRVSHCSGFSSCRAQALGVRASVVVAHRVSSCRSRALECRLSSCGARA